jgi:hypothetical protein
MEVHGSCHCGHISYRAKANPEKVVICHCNDCQVLTGCAYRVSVECACEDFQLLTGEPKIYIKTADSGKKRVQAFCPDCGSPLYTEDFEKPAMRFLRVGSLKEKRSLTPRRQIWCESALPWAENISGITPKLSKQNT